MCKKLLLPIGGVLVVLGLLAIIFANSIEAETSTALSNATILIIRHAEEPSKRDGLSSRGTARAQGYIEYFKDFTIDGKPVKIDHLFAASDSSNSRRPRLTLEPIAQALGVSIDSQFKSKDFLKLAQKIETLPQGSNVLICWHHSDIPNLIGALGADAEKLLPNGCAPYLRCRRHYRSSNVGPASAAGRICCCYQRSAGRDDDDWGPGESDRQLHRP